MKESKINSLDYGPHKSLSIYIHIPFCDVICPYCDFNKFSKVDNLIPEFVDSIINEIELRSIKNTNIESLSFGGGTPSYLSNKDFELIFHSLKENFNFNQNIEISIEVNPKDINLEKVSLYEEIDSDAEIIEIESVGTKVAEGTVRNSIIAVSVASFFVMLYVLYAFRRLEKSYRFAFSAVLTLVHDVVLVTGIYALLGHIFGLQVNSVFIVALLTVIGYSVNDTIVIFDRIRENQIKFPDNKYSSNINISINESIIRSLGTSITTLLVLFSMLVLGGSTLREFIVVLILGVIVGTYSSIFIASQFLIIWEEGIKKK